MKVCACLLIRSTPRMMGSLLKMCPTKSKGVTAAKSHFKVFRMSSSQFYEKKVKRHMAEIQIKLLVNAFSNFRLAFRELDHVTGLKQHLVFPHSKYFERFININSIQTQSQRTLRYQKFF